MIQTNNKKQKIKFKNLNDIGISEKEELTSISVTQVEDKFNSEDFGEISLIRFTIKSYSFFGVKRKILRAKMTSFTMILNSLTSHFLHLI